MSACLVFLSIAEHHVEHAQNLHGAVVRPTRALGSVRILVISQQTSLEFPRGPSLTFQVLQRPLRTVWDVQPEYCQFQEMTCLKVTNQESGSDRF